MAAAAAAAACLAARFGLGRVTPEARPYPLPGFELAAIESVPATSGGEDDELVLEEKLLTETRIQYADGAPIPLPEERADAEKYRTRIARLRQSVTVHERNVDALKKELATVK